VAALYPSKAPGVYLRVVFEWHSAGLDAVQKRKNSASARNRTQIYQSSGM
jgi:hypothetical protein